MMSESFSQFPSVMAYDASLKTVILFGGTDETWAFNDGGWERIATTTQPQDDSYHTMTHVDSLGKIILTGGFDRTGETWLWDGSRAIVR